MGKEVPGCLAGRWVSELCDDDWIEITRSSVLWKHFEMDAIDMMDLDTLRKKYPGDYEYAASASSLTISFSHVDNCSASAISGCYRFSLTDEGRLSMYYRYTLDEPEKDPGIDSVWVEEYLYDKDLLSL